jgi:hypothetical protein
MGIDRELRKGATLPGILLSPNIVHERAVNVR